MAGASGSEVFSGDVNSKHGYHESIRQSVFAELDKNPLLTAKPLAKILNLPWPQYRHYLNRLRYQWKANYQNGLGLKCLSFHGVRANVWVPLDVCRVEAVKRGWFATRARNRMLVWKDRLGRLEWFETGLVKVWVRKPASEGKAVQLLANGFTKTELIWDMRVWERVRRSLWFHGATLAVETGVRLPYVCVELLKESNGVKVKMGDASDPTKLEIEFCYPKWAERNERLFEQLNKTLKRLVEPSAPNKFEKPDYVR